MHHRNTLPESYALRSGHAGGISGQQITARETPRSRVVDQDFSGKTTH